ncbi:DgyrCDS11432 [Dimorphilus gyrociliatus]|uniref:DgyrCDS11432 n=1 Tax=Dimorphilus gyrociliatus TaxID=2664684 RepID=A0A7I8W3H0_9ANNE|nr:DgyrCDS11432 [Dimorphilus gyrociliatus]
MSANNERDATELKKILHEQNGENENEKIIIDGTTTTENQLPKNRSNRRKERNKFRKYCIWRKISDYKDPVVLIPPIGWIKGRTCLPQNLNIYFRKQNNLIKPLTKDAIDESNTNYFLFRHDDDYHCWPNLNNSFVNQSWSLGNDYRLGIRLSDGCDFYDFSESRAYSIGRKLSTHLNYVQLMQSGKVCKSKLKRGIAKSLYKGIEESKRETIFHSPFSFGLKEAKRSSDIFTIASESLMNNLEDEKKLYALLDNFYFNFKGDFKPGFFPYAGSLSTDEFQFVNWCYMKAPLFFNQPSGKYAEKDIETIFKLFSKHKKLVVNYHQNNETKPFTLSKKIQIKDHRSFRSRYYSVVSVSDEDKSKEGYWSTFKTVDHEKYIFFWLGDNSMCLSDSNSFLAIRECGVKEAVLQHFAYRNRRLYLKNSMVCIPNYPFMRATIVNKEERGCSTEVFIKKNGNNVAIVNKYGFKLRASMPDVYILHASLSDSQFILAFNNLHSEKPHWQKLDYKNIHEMQQGRNYEVVCSDGNPRRTYENGRISEEIRINVPEKGTEYCFVTDKGAVAVNSDYGEFLEYDNSYEQI